MRGVVVLPPSYSRTKQHYTTAYVIPGFASDISFIAKLAPIVSVEGMANGVFPEMFHVVLDESCPGGTHEFADSVNNGPWGQALTQELIPHLESKYRMISKPKGRFLTGHSSGGWAVLWIQVNYPDLFGGAWPTAPDPSDFRNFYGANLRANPPENLYQGADGARRAECVQWRRNLLSSQGAYKKALAIGSNVIRTTEKIACRVELEELFRSTGI
jgi:enterochelin esterase-like enzyme